MPKFHRLYIKDIRQETADCVSIALAIPEDLKPRFQYLPGQYLTFKKEIKGEDIRRSYSICSAPVEGEWRVAVKKVEGGRFSTYANEVLEEGMSLEVMPPMGNFYPLLNRINKKHYLGFAAGSGITPVLSIIKAVLSTEPDSRFTLFYGNRNFESIIFREELEALKNTYLNRFSLHHVLSREHLGAALFNGRITKEKCSDFFRLLIDSQSVDDYFVCGPEQMIFDVKDCLEDLGVDKKKIHFELFTTASSRPKAPVSKKVPTPSFDSKITIRLDGDTFDLAVKSDGDSILDTALKNGMDLPFACKGGVCCTCRAKIEAGKVDMDVNYALEEEEVAAGYVLTCQSHPRTDTVIVNFDA